jgi:hypothetical protein
LRPRAGKISTLIEFDAFLLFRSNLVNIDVIEAGVGKLLDFFQMNLRIRIAYHVLGDIFFADEFSPGLLLCRNRKFVLDGSGYSSGPPVRPRLQLGFALRMPFVA